MTRCELTRLPLRAALRVSQMKFNLIFSDLQSNLVCSWLIAKFSLGSASYIQTDIDACGQTRDLISPIDEKLVLDFDD